MTGRWRHLISGSLISIIVVSSAALFSSWPFWQSLPEDHALLRLSFTKSGVRDCRDRTAEELAALARNMRRAQICERRRAPVYIEMDLNGQLVLAENLLPGGLSGSGPSRVYQRFELPSGDYDIDLRLRDDPKSEAFTSVAAWQVHLAPAQSLAIDYSAAAGGFFLH